MARITIKKHKSEITGKTCYMVRSNGARATSANYYKKADAQRVARVLREKSKKK
jgi:hypothetical protein